MSYVDKDKVKDLLGSGLSVEIVATAVGCHQSRISQLMAEEHFANEVALLRMKNLSAAGKRDQSIDAIEDKLIERISDMVDMVTNPDKLLSMFRVFNAAKRRNVAPPNSMVVNNTVVNLTLPDRVRKKYSTTVNGEVVEAEGQTLVTMPAGSLVKSLIEKNPQAKQYKDVQRFLPSSAIGYITNSAATREDVK